ncbi:MAG: hypothetical protein Fur0010_11070 [Bdellovibrio sp.]
MIQKELKPALKIYWRRVIDLITSGPFWFLTIFGNATTLALAGLVYHFEVGHNPKILTLFDACWWAFATITTIGYGDVVPVTTIGRAIGFVLMFMGTGFFVTYTALFSNALLGRELDRLDSKMELMKDEVQEIGHEEEQLEQSLDELKRMIIKLDKHIKNKREIKNN